MYKPYIELIPKLFPNSKIVIDRFHISAQTYRALNITRVKVMNKDKVNYNKLKHYWKLILKCELDLDNKQRRYSKHFGKHLTNYDIVQYLINTNDELKASYELYQGIIKSLRFRDSETFINIIHSKQNNISIHMKNCIKTFINFEKHILNSFAYEYNNGIIEGTNNLIKVIKRISFGYRSFSHFRTRILLIKDIVKF